jgi:hypothetical protein
MHNSEPSAGVIPAPLLDWDECSTCSAAREEAGNACCGASREACRIFFEHFFANLSKGQSGRLSGRKRLCLAKESVLQTRADWLSRTLALA